MRSKVIPFSPTSEKNSEDRATAAMLAAGGADDIPAFALRHWRPEGGSTIPVFTTWLLGVGRFCLTVKYGRYSLKGADWRIDTGAGARSTPSPLDQARMEALQVSQALQRRLNRSVPVHRSWRSSTWSATGASSAWPAGAAFPCSGIWSATPASWLKRQPAPAFHNRWISRWSWRRFPHWWKTLLLSPQGHSAPQGGVPDTHRDSRRRNQP